MSLRYKLMSKIITDNIPEDLQILTIQDVLSVDWSKFEFNGTEEVHILSKYDIERPDLLSYKKYNTVIYQNIIFLINNIGNILFTDTKTSIILPSLQQLKNFVLKYRNTN